MKKDIATNKPYNLRVNSLSTERYAKFIVSEQGEELVFDSLGPEEVNGKLRHKAIVEKQNIEGIILGGGDLHLHEFGLSLDGMSGDYGIVHQSILDGFLPLLVKEYKARGLEVIKAKAYGSDSKRIKKI